MPDNILELRDVKTHFTVRSGLLRRREVGAVKAVDTVLPTSCQMDRP